MENDSCALMQADERPVAQVTNSDGVAPLVLVCEYASSFIPAALDDLGLSQDARYANIACRSAGIYDPKGSAARSVLSCLNTNH